MTCEYQTSLSVQQFEIWRGCPRRQCVLGMMRFVTSLTRSVSFLRKCSINWNLFYEHQPFGGAYFIEDSAGR